MTVNALAAYRRACMKLKVILSAYWERAVQFLSQNPRELSSCDNNST
ncbi:hypothetical protein CES85_4056 [Ochrobactrum quorumnocens]|uniref:Uncharacterized protein n=1 Tax=Ochrobactrum quorumnocens TaxID=271865 RepID=A0A248U915_9HYPH|nr:hypothetical protein CES85_4056 [[Ochrobactrum] quorumnocens]